jgi:light-regulated signal transduction histidine kinase (bacteriophytochrome)
MNEIINEIISNDFSQSLENTDIKIHQLPIVEGDPVLIQQVWLNLISNAIKYSRKVEKPVIEIGSNSDSNMFVYFIKDNGAGFNPEYAGKLFNTFQRLHTNDQFEGTGVGLAIVKRIILKHGGEVWAHGKENEGATFFFSLPAK